MKSFWTSLSRFTPKKETEKDLLAKIDLKKLPQHIAIIMDGNGRWAQKRGMPRYAGHRFGVESLRKVIETCVELKIEVLTVYAFSTENWKRPQEEVNVLMKLLVDYLRQELNQLHRQNISIKPIGDIQALPEEAQAELIRASELTLHNQGLKLNVALNYGGRAEILEGVRKIAAKVVNNEVRPHEITDELFASCLFTSGQPDPDLLIRPSGELRISNFLLWQLAYAEFWYTDVLWPDFSKIHLLQAIIDFQQRNRRYGGL